MASFASVAELANYLGITMQANDPRGTLALTLATGAIQALTEQLIEAQNDDEVTLDGDGRQVLLLPQIPVRAVSVVVETISGVSTELVVGDEWTWEENGILRRPAGWTVGHRTVAVTYSHGYTEIPDAIKAVCLAMAARIYRNPGGGVVQKQIGSYSVSYDPDVAKAATELELDVLSRYRLHALG